MPQAVEALVRAGADVNALDGDGNTPLISASSVEVADRLLQAGARIDITNGLGQTALGAACESSQRYAIAMLLISAGADPNRGRKPLHAAVTPLSVWYDDRGMSGVAKAHNKLAKLELVEVRFAC